MDLVTPVQAVRKAVNDGMGLSGLPEAADAVAALEDMPDTFVAYAVRPPQVVPGPAMEDQTVTITVDFYYVRRTVEGEESEDVMRTGLDQIAGIIKDYAQWTVPNYVIFARPVDPGWGAADPYAALFMRQGQPYVAGHIGAEMLTIQ